MCRRGLDDPEGIPVVAARTKGWALVLVVSGALSFALPTPYAWPALFVGILAVLTLIGFGRRASGGDAPDGAAWLMLRIDTAVDRPMDVAKVLREYTDAPAKEVIAQVHAAPTSVAVRLPPGDEEHLLRQLERFGTRASLDVMPESPPDDQTTPRG